MCLCGSADRQISTKGGQTTPGSLEFPSTDLQHAAVLQQGARAGRLLPERSIQASDRTLVPDKVCNARQAAAAHPDGCCCSIFSAAAGQQGSWLQQARKMMIRYRSCLESCLHAGCVLGLPINLAAAARVFCGEGDLSCAMFAWLLPVVYLFVKAPACRTKPRRSSIQKLRTLRTIPYQSSSSIFGPFAFIICY